MCKSIFGYACESIQRLSYKNMCFTIEIHYCNGSAPRHINNNKIHFELERKIHIETLSRMTTSKWYFHDDDGGGGEGIICSATNDIWSAALISVLIRQINTWNAIRFWALFQQTSYAQILTCIACQFRFIVFFFCFCFLLSFSGSKNIVSRIWDEMKKHCNGVFDTINA